MTAAELAALQPTAQTGTEIRAALARIAGAKQSAESRMRDLEAEAEERRSSFTLTSVNRRKLTDQIEDLQLDISMLNALSAQVEAPLSNIELVERDERLGAERIALRAEMAALDEKWAVKYPPLHEALGNLLAERRDLATRVDAHSDAASVVFRRVELNEFRLSLVEVQLLKTPEQRAEAAVTPHERAMRSMAAMDEARRMAVAARAPIIVNDAAPKPVFTVGGVVQESGNHTW